MTTATPRHAGTSGFGHAMLEHWALDPAITYLNHGTVGAPPRVALAAQQSIRDAIELQPSRFMLRELTEVIAGMPRPDRPRMRVAAEAVAAFVGARGEDVAFVDNATTGVNAVLRSFPLSAGDQILLTDHTYGAVAHTARFVARERGALVVTVELPHPARDPEAIVDAVAGAITERTRLLLIDHITSLSALVLPVREIARRARERGVPVLVDGAHAPGAIALDIPSLGVDWYTGNLHKWAYSPRSSGILWVKPERKAGLHPTVISWGLDRGFSAEFDLQGTRDPSAHLAAPAGIEFMRTLGIEAVRAHNHDLAFASGRLLAARWNTRFEADERMIGTMATVPLPAALGSTVEDAARLRDALLFEDHIEVEVHPARGALRARISAQVYNEASDYRRLADAVLARNGSPS